MSQPGKITMPNGEVFRLVLMRVVEKYEDGSPLDLTYIKDDGMVELDRGDWFVTAYVRDDIFKQFTGDATPEQQPGKE